MTTDKAKDFDGLPLNAVDALDNMEKLIGAVSVLINTHENEETIRDIINFTWNYQCAVLYNMRETGK
ncbi:hypothetical protein RLV03_000401 [Salmonella enterica subsp. enterica serovar Benin]|nr:hypothetical protein [Salmonella enterica subsp. enterica serovar Benin]ELD9381958.1 hypothetical protein [Salmonella enterica subsp. enterica serovar Benin]